MSRRMTDAPTFATTRERFFAAHPERAILAGAALLVLVALMAALPPDGLVHPLGTSFPSGHATYAGATCVALVLVFTTPGSRRTWWRMLAGLATAGMAWSRIYLQAHWLSHVIAGAMLGVDIAMLVFGAAQTRLPGRRSSGRR